MRRFFGAAACAAVALTVVIGSASGAGPTYSNDFETDTAGWFDNDGTITQRASGYVNAGGYASGINAAGGSDFAGLDRGPCSVEAGGGGDTVYCSGPFTRWGGYNATWTGGYTTQVDIYLDTAYANANPDTYGGNLAELTPPTGDGTLPANKGTRFDYTSAINKAGDAGPTGHLRDFGFNVSTGYDGDNCDGFMITGQTNVNRTGANPNIGQHDPQCIDVTGWYTFKHTFSSKNGFLDVVMDITPVGSATPVASWEITGIDADGTYGCNRYGWFSNQEIFGLPIDNASMTGCGTPPAPPSATLNVTKFYDANANGTKDGSETDINDWKVKVEDGTTQVGTTPFTASGLAPDDYTVSEFSPIQANWIATTPTSVPVTLGAGDNKSVSFGNVCRGDGGGLTIGFWSNKNGQALIDSGDLAALTALNLVSANGTAFNPTTKAQVKNWLSDATATNMAYMLSAQLAAMKLNVLNGNVAGSALVYAPGVTGANAAGFITVDALMTAANNDLGMLNHNVTKSSSPFRSYQETLKNALDQANQDNSTVFAQPGPCAFSFTPSGPCEAGTGNAGAGYNAIPTDVEHCSPPSEGFEANSDNEFGDRVTLNTAGGTKLVSMTVDFQSYGCGDSGHWHTGDCVTVPGGSLPDTFTVPGGITAKIYNAVTLAPIATSNVLNANIPFRPSASASCTGANVGKWFDVVSGACNNSLSVPLTFTFPAGTTFTNGQDVVWTVQFNTTHAGYAPIGEATACFPTNPGCGYDSLNVGAKSYPNAPYAGTDVDSSSVYRSHGNPNYGGPLVPLGAETGWAGFRPLGKIVLGP